VAGETSADLHGANLVLSLKKLAGEKKLPLPGIMGLGGPQMQSAGVEIFHDLTQLASAGLDPLRHFNKFAQIFRQLITRVRKEKPALAVLIDFPDFNLRLAKKLKESGIPVIYYISPQIWAWRPGRIKTIARVVDKMLVIFEFEKKLYQKYHIPVEFVGHPLLDVIAEVSNQKLEVRKRLNLKENDFIIGLLPGSRENEVKRHLPEMLKAGKILLEKWSTGITGNRTNAQPVFIIAAAPKISPSLIKRLISNFPLPAHIYYNQPYEVMQASNLLMTSSGTATVEAAIFGIPMVVMYKVSFLTALAFKPLIKTPYYSMVNILAGKKVVPEFIQQEARAEKIAAAALEMIQKNRLPQISGELIKIRQSLGSPGASTRAAEVILDHLHKCIPKLQQSVR
ncbi:MAG: lipid-A-disaccharide synthase, partial [Planctomycetota bacterium]